MRRRCDRADSSGIVVGSNGRRGARGGRRIRDAGGEEASRRSLALLQALHLRGRDHTNDLAASNQVSDTTNPRDASLPLTISMMAMIVGEGFFGERLGVVWGDGLGCQLGGFHINMELSSIPDQKLGNGRKAISPERKTDGNS